MRQLLVSYHNSMIAWSQWKQFLPPEEFKPTWQHSRSVAYSDDGPKASKKALFPLGIKYFRIFWIYCSSAFSMKDFYLATRQYSFWESTFSSQLTTLFHCYVLSGRCHSSLHPLSSPFALSLPMHDNCDPVVLTTLLRASIYNTVWIGRINKISKNSVRIFEGVSPYIL